MKQLRLLALSAIATFALVGGAVTPVAADAATRASSTYAEANHSTIHLGSRVTISGWVTPNLHGHAVHLQRYYSAAWHTMADQALNSTSRFSFITKPSAALKYLYRVYDPATKSGYRLSTSRTVAVTVQKYGPVTLTSYSGTGHWQGPTVRIPTADYTIGYSYSCTDTNSNFLSVDWNGADGFGDYLFAEAPAGGTSGAGNFYGHYGAQSGYFDADAQLGCDWAFRVTYKAWH